MSAININKNNFENEVLNSDKTVLLDFWASWCAPCRMVVPIVEEIADERRDIKVGKINVDEEPDGEPDMKKEIQQIRDYLADCQSFKG
jgi:thioredoxin 1